MNLYTSKIIEILNKNGWTISTIESVTGGMFGSNLVSIPNVSKCFIGGYVSYTNFAKEKVVGINSKIINQYGAVSKETAKEMALLTARKFQTDFAISITGNAGPNPIENKPVGLAYIGLVIVDKVEIFEIQSQLRERNDIRIDLTSKAIVILYNKLKQLESR